MKRLNLFAALLIGAALLIMLTVYITEKVVVSRNPFAPIGQEPNLTGTIVQIEKELNSVLVIGGLLEEDLSTPVGDLISSGKYPDVYWIGNVNTRWFQLGDMVDVWFNEVNDSYPAQTSAVKIRKTGL